MRAENGKARTCPIHTMAAPRTSTSCSTWSRRPRHAGSSDSRPSSILPASGCRAPASARSNPRRRARSRRIHDPWRNAYGPVWKENGEEGREGDQGAQKGHAEERALRQEGEEQEAGDRDRIVRGAQGRRQGTEEKEGRLEEEKKEVDGYQPPIRTQSSTMGMRSTPQNGSPSTTKKGDPKTPAAMAASTSRLPRSLTAGSSTAPARAAGSTPTGFATSTTAFGAPMALSSTE